MDPIKEAIELGLAEDDKALKIVYWLNNIGNIICLIDIFKNIIGTRQITASLKEISIIIEKLC